MRSLPTIPRPPLRHMATAAAVAALAACSMIPDRSAPDVTVPAAWDGPAAAAAAPEASASWWRSFGNAELTALVEQSLAANHDLAAARERIAQARAALRSTGAGQWPTLDGSGAASRRNSTSDGTGTIGTTWSGSLRAAYEIDLWGGNEAATESARQGAEAARFDAAAAALVVQAEVADSYVRALAARDRLGIAHANLDAARQTLDLVRTRVAEGLSAPLELAQQEASVASIEAGIPALEGQVRAAETALAVLAGQPPQGFRVGGGSLADLALPAADPGLPADLLTRRPDIRAAEAALHGANADIGAARAAFLPAVNLSLGGSLSGLAGGGTGTLLDLASGLAAPIFSAGRLEGALDSARAREAELLARYRQTTLTAFKDVEDALTAADSSARRADLLTVAADRAGEATRVAREQYVAGAGDFLSVLDSQRSQLSAEDSLVQARADQFTAAVALFKALGGGWRDGGNG